MPTLKLTHDEVRLLNDMFSCISDLGLFEGYVLHNKYGTFKIVNRQGFSRANFNLVREWD